MASGVGIDLGAHSIKVVDLRVTEKGAQLRRALVLDRPALAARGVDPSDRRRVAALLKEEMTKAGISTKEVSLGISGKDSIIRYTHVPPVPAWRLKIIMDYEVGEVAEKIGEKLASDYRVLPVTREADDDQAIVIGLAKEPALDSLLADLGAAGITVAKAIPAPLAVYAAYAGFGKKPDLESPDDELWAVVDVGAENLNVALLLNGNLAFARSASFGGRNFTEAIARDLGVDLERAEAIKLREGSLERGGGGSREETVNTLRAGAAQLLSMVQSSLKFARTQTGARFPEPTRYILCGGGAALPGLVSYLQSGLGKPVEVFHPQLTAGAAVGGEAARLVGSAPGNLAVALGLAVAGVRREGIELSLLPTRYRERRLFRDRTLYLYLAASFLLVFLALRLVQGFSESGSAHARKRYLDTTQSTLKQHHATMLANREENSRAKARINRILREAELGPFQAFVLDFLGRKVGAEVKITGCKLVLGEDPETEEPLHQVLVEGAADNASQKAHERIKALEAELSAEARVARVETVSINQTGNWYEFKIQLTPSYQTQK